MDAQQIEWPKKKRELVTAFFDSTRWNDFEFRDDDIIVDTWAKAGTTWMQQIVSQIVLGPSPGLAAASASPWLDMRVQPFDRMKSLLDEQTHRRFIKSHLPIDALVVSPKAKYIYVGRDARDVAWSFYNHSCSYTDMLLGAFNNPPGLPGQPVAHPNCDIKTFYLEWLETGIFNGSHDFPSLWDHVQGWWDARRLPNVLLVHFANLKNDLPGEMRKIAKFLDVAVSDKDWPLIEKHCSFDYMRDIASQEGQMEMAFKGGGKTFFNKGTNGQWKELLSAEEIALCDQVAAKHLTPDCAHWLRTGELPTERET